MYLPQHEINRSPFQKLTSVPQETTMVWHQPLSEHLAKNELTMPSSKDFFMYPVTTLLPMAIRIAQDPTVSISDTDALLQSHLYRPPLPATTILEGAGRSSLERRAPAFRSPSLMNKDARPSSPSSTNLACCMERTNLTRRWINKNIKNLGSASDPVLNAEQNDTSASAAATTTSTSVEPKLSVSSSKRYFRSRRSEILSRKESSTFKFLLTRRTKDVNQKFKPDSNSLLSTIAEEMAASNLIMERIANENKEVRKGGVVPRSYRNIMVSDYLRRTSKKK